MITRPNSPTESGFAVCRREIWRSYRSLTDGESRRAFIRTMRSVIDPGGQSVSAIDRLYLAERMPVLIVWGEKDRIIPISHAHEAAKAAPNSRLEIIPGVGHFPQSEDPATFVEILRDFLASSEPTTSTASEHRDRLQGKTGPVDPQAEKGSPSRAVVRSRDR